MGDSRRFDLFTKEIVQVLKPEMKIADVAGGKGYLRLSLSEHSFKNVETWDKRYKKVAGNQKFSYFDYETAPSDFDAVIGMHPDEGTDHLIMYAAKHRVPAIICPCCVKPSARAFWGRRKYNDWTKHLIALGESEKLKVAHKKMKFNGRNDLFVFLP